MIPNNQPEPVRVAAKERANFAMTVAKELGRSTSEKGVDRLAAALADERTGSANFFASSKEFDPPVVSTHPAETPVRLALLDIDLRIKGAKAPEIRVVMRDGNVQWQVLVIVGEGCAIGSGGTLAESLEKCYADAAKIIRKATIAARIEKELAEADAAEAALAQTMPLPIEPFDGVHESAERATLTTKFTNGLIVTACGGSATIGGVAPEMPLPLDPHDGCPADTGGGK